MAISITSRMHNKNLNIFNCNEVEYIKSMPKQLISEFKKKNYLLMHFNAYQHSLPLEDLVDAYLAAKGILSPNIKQNKNNIINLSTRNFLPKYIEVDELSIEQKIWDILIVANAVRYKNIDRLKTILEKIHTHGKSVKVLIIAPRENVIFNHAKWYSNLQNDFASKKTYPSIVDIVSVIRPTSADLYPLSRQTIFTFMKLSKFLFVPSDSEGECRVINEALSVGTPVICFSHLEGAGQDYLNTNNSIKLHWPNCNVEDILSGIDHYSKFKVEGHPDFDSATNKSKLLQAVNQTFNEKFQVADLKDLDLSMALAGHINKDDCGTISSYYKMYTYFLKNTFEYKLNYTLAAYYRYRDIKLSLKKYFFITLSVTIFYKNKFIRTINFKTG